MQGVGLSGMQAWHAFISCIRSPAGPSFDITFTIQLKFVWCLTVWSQHGVAILFDSERMASAELRWG
jgi:hypothetical protein